METWWFLSFLFYILVTLWEKKRKKRNQVYFETQMNAKYMDLYSPIEIITRGKL